LNMTGETSALRAQRNDQQTRCGLPEHRLSFFFRERRPLMAAAERLCRVKSSTRFVARRASTGPKLNAQLLAQLENCSQQCQFCKVRAEMSRRSCKLPEFAHNSQSAAV